MGLAACAMALAPFAALGAFGDVSPQGYLPGGGAAPTDVDGAAFSPDGRYLLFTSASPISGQPTGGVRQLFMRDLLTGAVQMVSTTADGHPSTGPVDDDADAPPFAASLDGRFVVFSSTAADLMPGDANGGARDVFRKDTRTGRITIVSRDHLRRQVPSGVTGQPSISSDGSRVAFASGAEPLAPGDANGVADIYVSDLRARAVVLVSRTAAGAQSPEPVQQPAISADGRAVAFQGTGAAAVLAGGDANGIGDVYVARPATRSIVLASVADGGSPTGISSLPSISGDGSRVAFASTAPLVAGDTGTTPDAYVRDLAAGTTRRMSTGASAARPAISANGARVAFASGADVLVRDVASGAVFRASRLPDGSPTPGPASRAAITGVGSVASFTTQPAGASASGVFVTEAGAVSATAPALTARATISGRRVTVAGHASDPAGIARVAVGRRVARIGDDGAYAVSFTARLGTEEVAVRATSGLGAESATAVGVTRIAGERGRADRAPRPRALRASAARPWVRATFRLPVRAAWRVEVRRRLPGITRARAFRMVVARSGTSGSGRRSVRLRIPARTAPGDYQVRVLISSARGLGTSARTIRIR